MNPVASPVAVAILALAAASASAQVIPVDISATANCGASSAGAIPVKLSTGSHTMRPVARLYTAWNAWGGQVSGCDAGGGNCSMGWFVQWSVYVGDDPPVS